MQLWKFASTGIQISKDGREYLGSATGDQEFTNDLVMAKVNDWANEIKQLSIYVCHKPTTCCVLSFHTWPLQQVELPNADNEC